MTVLVRRSLAAAASVAALIAARAAAADAAVAAGDDGSTAATNDVGIGVAGQTFATGAALPAPVAAPGGPNTTTSVRVAQPGDNAPVRQRQASDGEQLAPGNANTSVRVLSPGDDGPVTQTTSSGAGQTAPVNSNTSTRVASPGDEGAVTQRNTSHGTQAAPGNLDRSVRADSAGTEGDVRQSNANAVADAQSSRTAGPANVQNAAATALATQVQPTNSTGADRVASDGRNGAVTQENANAADARAATQHSSRDQGAGPQTALNEQSAVALADATQFSPSNDAGSTRLSSDGDDGPVDQRNTDRAHAQATNANDVRQDAGKGTTADQSATNVQTAAPTATALQTIPSNDARSTRVDSAGDRGRVTQANTATSTAKAENSDTTIQDARQSGGADQRASQRADNVQVATPTAVAEQRADTLTGGGNTNVSDRAASAGDERGADQSNTVTAASAAENRETTRQGIEQQGPPTGTQDAAQSATSRQLAQGTAFATQEGSGNTNAPLRQQSDGRNAPAAQTNRTDSSASAVSADDARQSATQRQGGAGVQTVRQDADRSSSAQASPTAFQSYLPLTNASVQQRDDAGDTSAGRQTTTNTAQGDARSASSLEQSAAQRQGRPGDQQATQNGTVDSAASTQPVAAQTDPSNADVQVTGGGDNHGARQTAANQGAGRSSSSARTVQRADQAGDQQIDQTGATRSSATTDTVTEQFAVTTPNTAAQATTAGDNEGGPQSATNRSDATAGSAAFTGQSARQQGVREQQARQTADTASTGRATATGAQPTDYITNFRSQATVGGDNRGAPQTAANDSTARSSSRAGTVQQATQRGRAAQTAQQDATTTADAASAPTAVSTMPTNVQDQRTVQGQNAAGPQTIRDTAEADGTARADTVQSVRQTGGTQQQAAGSGATTATSDEQPVAEPVAPTNQTLQTSGTSGEVDGAGA